MSVKSIQVIDRAVDILNYLAEHNELGVTELGTLLKLHKSTVHRILVTLEERSIVEKNLETGKYRLGIGMFRIGAKMIKRFDINNKVRPHMVELVNKIDQTVYFSLFKDGRAFITEIVESNKAIRMSGVIGSEAPLHAWATGKILLANYSNVLEALKDVELKSFTNKTITEYSKLKDHIKQVKENGYALDIEEWEENMICIAFPVNDYTTKVIGSLHIAISKTTWKDKKEMDFLKDELQKTARIISKTLGYIET